MNSMIKEFREFAFKGNLIDMAVGVIIGGAFGTVMKSLVDDIFMPILGLVTSGVNFNEQFLPLGKMENGEAPSSIEQAQEAGVAVLTYGNFISSFISFLLVALAVFLVVVKVMGAIKKLGEKPAEEEPEADPEPTNEEKMLDLLADIRDNLKAK